MSTFLLEIITPDRVVFSDQVEMVTATSVMGTIGILPQHVPLFSKLVQGEVKISKDNKDFFLAIGGGFIEVTKDKTYILVTEAYRAEEINEQEILKARKRAEEAIQDKSNLMTLSEAQSIFRRSEIALKVLHRHRSSRNMQV
ncbi:ATP synthase F1 subunit epsilon [Candidatus Gottesmanbacteria bacterium RIFCSPHIGHO2_02_FULL_40_13]|uniref:ATP synthase epsilon chain n=1 Tax=Candidatus Gottesmanbacteria bacterium RIFCSPHIGHO2_02_FULL_40_13 TaxID=1798384 RepID=A0A1F6A5H0_9BACT|nr:MAG: ATP synthase F1 subunit epsilon [Candidatus Gottesmanbacteria bacterium RIFCSPHIGHO2_02_FULL_40_13]